MSSGILAYTRAKGKILLLLRECVGQKTVCWADCSVEKEDLASAAQNFSDTTNSLFAPANDLENRYILNKVLAGKGIMKLHRRRHTLWIIPLKYFIILLKRRHPVFFYW